MRTIRCALFLVLAIPAFAAPRIALVVGNSNYAMRGAKIPVATKDAAAIAKRLCEVGFDVDLVSDTKLTDLRKAITRFSNRLKATPGAEAIVFYAGHGAQLVNVNYLIPTDARNTKKLKKNSVSLTEIYEVFAKTKPSFSLIMLDACRTKIFGDRKGLAKFDEGAPSGTILAFATGPNKTVGGSVDGKTSAYTKAILQHLGEPGTTLSDFFMQVRNAVELYTDEHDTPWENTSQKVPFVFRDPAYLHVERDGGIDDDLVLTAGAGTYISSIDQGSKQLRLHIGDNVITATVVNFRSKNDRLEPEGWRYGVVIRAVKGEARYRLHGEEHPPPPGRFGGSFVAARAIARVHRLSGEITFPEIEPVVWEDGFSLLGVEQDDWLYESIRWAVGHGAPLRDAVDPSVARSEEEVRQSTATAHETAIAHQHGSAEETEQAHRPHLRAKELVDAAKIDDVRAVIERVRRAVLAEVDVNLTGLHNNEVYGPKLQQWLADGRYAEIRWLYRALVSIEQARVLLDSVSNDEIKTILTR